jgi:MinD-like ATPase involved in chromosome partitioning or flagellar assembly
MFFFQAIPLSVNEGWKVCCKQHNFVLLVVLLLYIQFSEIISVANFTNYTSPNTLLNHLNVPPSAMPTVTRTIVKGIPLRLHEPNHKAKKAKKKEAEKKRQQISSESESESEEEPIKKQKRKKKNVESESSTEEAVEEVDVPEENVEEEDGGPEEQAPEDETMEVRRIVNQNSKKTHEF